MTVFRLTFETVSPGSLYKFCNADPSTHKNVTQIVPNSQIPDEYWHEVEKITDDPWQQHNQLVVWETQDREFIRNVQLFEQIVEPQWRKL